MMMFKRRSTPIKTSIAVEATSPKIGKTWMAMHVENGMKFVPWRME